MMELRKGLTAQRERDREGERGQENFKLVTNKDKHPAPTHRLKLYIDKLQYNTGSDMDQVATKPVFGVSSKAKRDSNQSPHLQRLARKLKVCMYKASLLCSPDSE